MKKFRFFSSAVAVVAVLFVSVWAGSASYPFTFNIPNITVQSYSNSACFTMTGNANQYMTNVNDIRGTLTISAGCAASFKLQLTTTGVNPTVIDSITVTTGNWTGRNYILNFPLPPPPPTPPYSYPANGQYCLRLTATRTATVPLCAATLTNGRATFNWLP
jgi:hypothetical protein